MSDDSSTPSVFHADTLPRRATKYAVTFRFAKGEIALSKNLFQLLDAAQYRRVAFVFFRGNWYITRVDRGGFWVNTIEKSKWGICTAEVHNKPFSLVIMRQMGHSPTDVVYIPVAPHQVGAADLLLDPAEYPYPLFRIVTDQKTLKL